MTLNRKIEEFRANLALMRPEVKAVFNAIHAEGKGTVNSGALRALAIADRHMGQAILAFNEAIEIVGPTEATQADLFLSGLNSGTDS